MSTPVVGREEALRYADAHPELTPADVSRHFGGKPSPDTIRSWLRRRAQQGSTRADQGSTRADQGSTRAAPGQIRAGRAEQAGQEVEAPIGQNRADQGSPTAQLSDDVRTRLRAFVNGATEFLGTPDAIADPLKAFRLSRTLASLLKQYPDLMSFDERSLESSSGKSSVLDPDGVLASLGADQASEGGS